MVVLVVAVSSYAKNIYDYTTTVNPVLGSYISVFDSTDLYKATLLSVVSYNKIVTANSDDQIGIRVDSPSFDVQISSNSDLSSVMRVYNSSRNVRLDVQVGSSGGLDRAVLTVSGNELAIANATGTAFAVRSDSGLRFVGGTTTPTIGVNEGTVYYHKTSNKLLVYTGAAWEALN